MVKFGPNVVANENSTNLALDIQNITEGFNNAIWKEHDRELKEFITREHHIKQEDTKS